MNDAIDLNTAHEAFKEASEKYKKSLKLLGNKKYLLMQKEGEVHEAHWAKTQTNEMSMSEFNQLLKHETWQEKMSVDVARTALNIAKQEVEDTEQNLNVIKKLISIK